MRSDSLGLFWYDEPPPKPEKKTKEKKTPPSPVWEKDDYLPGLDLAISARYPLLTDDELVQMSFHKTRLVFDIESYSNYFLIAFKEPESGKFLLFEILEHETINHRKLQWVLDNFTLVGFNSNNYDIPIATLACHPELCSPQTLKQATNLIIISSFRPSDIYKHFKIKKLHVDSIDLIELLPLDGSLKLYSGRIHAPKIQDLPFHPDKELTYEQKLITRHYCTNDLLDTELLMKEMKDQIILREQMSKEYKLDLRSKSDAQIAESVIGSLIEEAKGHRVFKPKIEPGTQYRYNSPAYLQFQTPMLQIVHNVVKGCWFTVGENGRIGLPDSVRNLVIKINETEYQMGIGGLHSKEKSVYYRSDDKFVLRDFDATSFYPKIILNQCLFPEHLGPIFLKIYETIVNRRILAKRKGDKTVAESLKITINGSFGKFGNLHSLLYSPQLVIQVTLSGQLSLLLLIELFELNGIKVVSANTDGIVTYTHRDNIQLTDQIVKYWEQITGFETEETRYKGLYSRDVNNYIAIKDEGKPKLKGTYRTKDISKNPVNEICVDAVVNYLQNQIPIEDTVNQCKDIRKFLTLRTVKGGAFKDGEFLGKTVRWYKSKESPRTIIYAKSGNDVPLSEGCRPLQVLPEQIPDDLNFEGYINESYEILKDVGLNL